MRHIHPAACASFSALGAILLLATVSGASADFTLRGTIMTPGDVIADGAIAVTGATISAVGPAAGSSYTPSPVAVQGIILPGFIDLHNHLTWNVLPRWIPSRKFSNRYEWQDVPEYDRNLVAPHNATLDAAACETAFYAEVKALAGGATSSIGSLYPSERRPDNRKCAAGLLRNLDLWSGLPFTLPDPNTDLCQKDKAKPQSLADVADNEVFPMEVAHDRLDFLRCELAAGVLRALVVHLSEGAPGDASARREFNMIRGAGILMPGLVIVHGTALRPDDFARMNGAGLVWSPRSNDELYGATTNITAALAHKVPIAIAPDWSPSGSAGMLQEMGYAARRYTYFSPETLVTMGTSVPARLARLEAHIGSLAPGLQADLLVIRAKPGATPAQSVVGASPADIRLVVVGGAPVYGDRDLLVQLLPAGTALETLKVCGAEKAINLAGTYAASSGQSLAEVEKKLNDSLAKVGFSLPAIECD